MNPTASLLMLAALVLGQAPTDFQQDFRGGKPLPPLLKLVGPNVKAFVTFEPDGLRIKLPPTGQQTKGWGVAGQFPLAGDFEITAAYEIITAEPPLTGAGVGVALSVAPDARRMKFAKIGRFWRIKEGSVYVAEYWSKEPPLDSNPPRFKPATSTSGKLRLERKGSLLRYLAAANQADDFQEIYASEVGTQDMHEVFFVANHNSSPSALDVRLLDLKIHAAGLLPDPAAVIPKASAPPPHPAEEPKPAGGDFAMALLAGLALTLLVALAAGIGVYRRKNPGADTSSSLIAHCAGCGKALKYKADLAGKKIKCPKCGQGTIVPKVTEGQA